MTVVTTSPPLAPAGAALRSADRWTAALLLLTTGGTHLALVPEHLEEAPYAGVLFVAVTVASAVLAVAVVWRDTPLVWTLAGALALVTLVAYVVSRTVGLPQLGDDVGNWTEPLSVPAVVAEVLLVALPLSGWASRRSRGR